MKVLFVDVDGVINTVGAELGFKHCCDYPIKMEGKDWNLAQSKLLDPACLYYLREIVIDTSCKIVVSSTWRLGATLEEMKSWFTCKEIADAIIDKTPSLGGTSHPELRDRLGRVQRGEEIKYWLDQHPEVTRYAVIDDDSDMDVVRDNFFVTDSYDGLKRKTAYAVIAHLNNDSYLDHYRMDIALTDFLAELQYVFGTRPAYRQNRTAIINLVRQLADQYKESMK